MTATGSAAPAVRARGLRKSFGSAERRVEALSGVDLEVGPGAVYGFLGPNGAGKTTTLRILTTLLPAGSGDAWVAGLDVRRQPREVRRRIGYVGQLGGADLSATGRENLLLQGRLYGMGRREAARRATELAGLLDLEAFQDRIVRTFSGGQRRRLEVALGIMHRPEVLFLDEPTLGLDPQNRAHLWEQLRGLRDAGTSILITTHYLDEADQLCDRVAIIDHGRIVAEGTPRELRQRYPAAVLITPRPDGTDLGALAEMMRDGSGVRDVRVADSALRVEVGDPTSSLAAIFDRLRSRGIEVLRVSLSEPSLDDVFLHETGRSLRDTGEPTATEVRA
jgi:ABC-2 type transport system ATP-binding protein